MRENSRRRLSAKTHFWDDDVEALVAPIMRDVVPGWQLINIISIIIFYERTLSRSLSLKKKNVKKVSSTKALPFLVVS
jgi:hypothetical protein